MANTFPAELISDVYAALNVVSRERIGLITAATIDPQASRHQKDEPVTVPIAPAATGEDITPGTNPPDTGDQTFTSAQITITKSRAFPFRWTGEEQRGINLGPGYLNMRQQQVAEAIRALMNEMEDTLAGEYVRSSRAFGTAGTTPFATVNELDDLAEVRHILDDNGAPTGDLQLVLGNAAMAKMRGFQASLFKVNEAGTSEFLREGMFSGKLQGFALRQSGQIKTHAKGTATGFDPDAEEPLGETTIVVAGSDSGTILAGDVVTWVGDTNKYIVNSATASGSATGNIVIHEPGLKVVLDAGDEGTIGNAYTANMAFSRSALILAARLPALPEEGDSAADRMVVQDPITGMAIELALYTQYRRVRYEVAAAWGARMIKPQHAAILLG